MIRIVLYRNSAAGLSPDAWQEGALHTFNDSNAVVENIATGELCLVPVKPEHLKFKVLMPDWLRLQQEAQQAAQRRGVSAGHAPL